VFLESLNKFIFCHAAFKDIIICLIS